MIDGLIGFLQRLKKINFTSIYTGLLLVLLFGGLVWSVFIGLMDIINRGGDGSTSIYLIVPSLLLIACILFLRKFAKTHSLTGLAQPLHMVVLPSVAGILFIINLLVEYSLKEIVTLDLYGEQFWLLMSVGTIYPLIQFIKGILGKELHAPRNWLTKTLRSLTIGSLIWLNGQIAGAAFTGLFFFFLGGLLSNGEIWLELLFFFIIIVALNTLKYYLEKTPNLWRSIIRGGIGLGLIALLANGSTYIQNYKNSQHNKRIYKANNIFKEHGFTQVAYEKVSMKKLEKSLLHRLKKNKNNLGIQNFNKIFDSTPEQLFGDKLGENRGENRRRRGTNASKVGENAEVVLDLAEFTNTISQESTSLVTTTYDFHFRNTSDQNQEVILVFQVPNKETVINELLLGLNGEMIGQVAPRNAAQKVYEDSLRVNIDPALLQKVGLNTYSLRVFPIPRKTGRALGKQRVQLSMVSPLSQGQETIQTPKFSMINLKFDDNSKLISKVYDGSSLLAEEIVNKEEVADYLGKPHNMGANKLPEITAPNITQLCKQEEINALLSGSNIALGLYQNQVDTNGFALFFDNSGSIERNKAHTHYANIFQAIKNHNGQLQDTDLYSYNHHVQKVAEVGDISYRGYSDSDSVLEFIDKENIRNKNVIIITDDDSFNISETELTNIDLSSLLSNTINVIQIGDKVKTYKSDFTNILSATQGNIFSRDQNTTDIINKIQEDNNLFAKTQGCTEINPEADDYTHIQQLLAGFVSKELLKSVNNKKDRRKIAEAQTQIAQQHNIVNQFNAMIALENAQQQRDLDRYSKQTDRYDSTYNNFNAKPQAPRGRVAERDIWGGSRQPINSFAEPTMGTLNSNVVDSGMGMGREESTQNISLAGSSGGRSRSGLGGIAMDMDYSPNGDEISVRGFFKVLLLLILVISYIRHWVLIIKILIMSFIHI